jgi:hypothetical protein
MAKTSSSAAAPTVTTIDTRPPEELVKAFTTFTHDSALPALVPGPDGRVYYPISTPKMRETVALRYRDAQSMIKLVEATFKKMLDPAKNVVAIISQTRDSFLDPAKSEKELCNRSITAYDARVAEERERELAEARRKAEAEAAEKRRVELAALAAAAKATTDKSVKAALKEQAASVAEAPLNVKPVALPEAGGKVDGEYTRTTWSAVVDDPNSFILACVAAEMLRSMSPQLKAHPTGQVIQKYLSRFATEADVRLTTLEMVAPVSKLLDALARSQQKDLNVTGLRAMKDSTFVTRAK